MQEPRLITADAIAPMDPALPPLLKNAGLVITGAHITAIGERSDLRRQFGELPTLRSHHPGILTPGLINAHTHLELSYQRHSANAPPRQSPTHFTHWIAALMKKYPPPEQLSTIITQAVREGVQESLRAGVTTFGDISRHATLSRQTLRTLPIRAVSFGEVVGLGKMRNRFPPLLDAASDTTLQSPTLSIGISPHAPYTVESTTLQAIVRRAILKKLPLQMHLAELSEEKKFLRDLSGPLGREWDLMLNAGILDDQIPLFDGGPIRWAQFNALLTAKHQSPTNDLPVLLAHVNYLDDTELSHLAVSNASVAYCPRTHAFFGHTPHRYRDMLAENINVCLGTDSLASNPDLNLLKEAQLLHTRDQFDPHQALDLITRRAALALGLDHQIGSLTPQKQADLVAFPVSSIQELIATAPTPTAVLIAGQPIP